VVLRASNQATTKPVIVPLGSSCTSPGLGIQILFTILRPSTTSAIPKGGFFGSGFRSLPVLWLLWALPPGVSRVMGAWVIGASLDGGCAWERVPAPALGWGCSF
jgi:hypothetical protein